MDFQFDVNAFLLNEISLVQSKDVADTQSYKNRFLNSNNILKENLSKVIDFVGEASYKAQGLNGPITNSFKIKTSDHHLYILKDGAGNKGLGTVVGIIKVGFKKLFLVDIYGQLHECRPLCVLDFYVHESKQRSGYGKQLFQYMIDYEHVKAHQLAIDRPSPKFISFLQKHYNLENPIRQVNKFVIFDSFFQDLAAVGIVEPNRRRSAPGQRNMFLKSSDPRNTQSASWLSRRNNQTQQLQTRDVTKELSKFSFIPPIPPKSSNDSANSSDRRRLRGVTTPGGERNSLRRGLVHMNGSNLSLYSRYSGNEETSTYCSSQSSKASAALCNRSSGELCSENPRILKTHTLHSYNTGTQITSLDNPLSTEFSRNVVPRNHDPHSYGANSVSSKDESYTIDSIIDELTMNTRTLGTSWNVFGVPPSKYPVNSYNKTHN